MALVFVQLNKHWNHLIPKKRGESMRQVLKFFDCVAALMARHLREMALASIQSFLDFMSAYSAGNDFTAPRDGEPFPDEECLVAPMLNLKLHCANQTVEFLPPLEQTREILVSCLQEIVMNTKEFPRVEEQLLAEKKTRPAYLLSVGWEEDFVQDMCARAVSIFERNVPGPRKYLRLYDAYKHLLNGDADKDRDRFLAGKASLSEFQVIASHYLLFNAKDCALIFLGKSGTNELGQFYFLGGNRGQMNWGNFIF